ncbi:MAG TPA: PAS domain-containing protein [Victivallales bacterium]|nr:PAS domain-containing protein [Victivallales bacterium]
MSYFNKSKFKQLRKSLKLTQQQAAEAIGKASYRTILRWEKGEGVPTTAEIKILAEMLQVPVCEISDLDKTIQQPYFYNSLSNLDKSTYDFSTKTETEKQKILIDSMKQNKMLTWQKQQKNIVIDSISTIINCLNVLVYKKNRDLKYTFINHYFLSYFGFGGENLILGQRNSDIWKNQDHWSEITKIEKEVLDTKLPVLNRVINIPKVFGSHGSGIVSIKPIFNNDGQVKEITGSIQDISGEQTLNEKFFYMESVLENLEHVIWIIKTKPYRHFIYINNAVEKIFNVRKREFYKNVDFWINYIHKDDRKRIKKEFHNRMKEMEYRIVVNGDQDKWIQHFSYNAIIKDSEIEFGVIKDITKKRNNEKIRLMMETTINSMNETFGLIGPNFHKILYYSKSREKIYGYPLKILTEGGHDFWLNKCVHPDDYKEQKQYSDNDIWPEIRKYRIIRKDRKIRWLETRRIKIRFDGQLCSAFFETDITNQLEKEKIYKDGYKQRNIDIAKKLKNKKIPLSIISESTNLSKNEVDNL